MAMPLGKHTDDTSSIDLGTQVDRDLNLQGKGEGRVPSGPLGWLTQSLLPLITGCLLRVVWVMPGKKASAKVFPNVQQFQQD